MLIMSSYTIICATSKSKQESDIKWQSLMKNISQSYDCHFDITYNNSKGLGEIYNNRFNEVDTDFVICVHDDVCIDDIHLFEKIQLYSKSFDIMGVAGGCNFSFKRYNRLSWMSVIDQQKDLSGCVRHKTDNDGNFDIFSSCNYGSVPRRVVSIDGLIMIFNKKAYKSIKFDEQFKFDFYDLDVCFSAIKEGLSIGVVPISVTHYSKGEGILKSSYLLSQNEFIKKWN